jgi:Mg-chelatase subunit ChlD
MKRSGERTKPSAVFRAASAVCALLALAGVALPFPTQARTAVVLIDVSESMGTAGIESSRRAAISLINSLAKRDRAGLVVFAGKPVVLASLDVPEKTAAVLSSARLEAPSPDQTDLSAALSAATALAKQGGGLLSVYLFSDGRATAGASIEGAAHARSGVAVNVIAAGEAAAGLVSEGLTVPETVHPGERILGHWRLRAKSKLSIDYVLKVDGLVISRSKADLEPGINDLEIEIESGGSGRHRIEIETTRNGLAIPEAGAGAFLAVGGAARVLLASGDYKRGGSPVAAALAAQGVSVEPGDTRILPDTASGYAGCSAVVLDNVSALEMTEGQQAALQEYVSGGGGLLVIGGESSLGRGEYYATPLEDMLPVGTDTRQRLLFTRAKLLFVIDHSGSMSEEVGSTTKQLAAMRGVMAALPELNPMDEVGVMSFDTEPTWDLPFTPVGEIEKIKAVFETMSRGGGTNLSNAIQEIIRGFGEAGPTKRHAVILTDGLTPEADFRELANRLASIGVTVSTIGIGEEVNEELLKNIAEWCGGAYYRAELDKIPTIVDKETIRITRDLIQEGRIAARITAASPVVEGLGDRLPPIGGYLVTTPKSLSTVLIEVKKQLSSGTAWDPLLATRRYGAGTVAVFTSDSGRRWLSAWSGTTAYNRLWAQVLRSVERPVPDRGMRISAIVEGGNARIAVDALGEDGRLRTGLHLVGRSIGNGASPFALQETAPGRYEGFAPLSELGLCGFEIRDPVTASWSSAWVWNPPGAEQSRLGPDEAALSRIAHETGGRRYTIDSVRPSAAVLMWKPMPLRALLLGLALFFLLADLYVRSTMMGQLRAAREALRAWWRRQRGTADSIRSLQWHDVTSSSDQSDERYEVTRRKLAEYVSRRSGYSCDKERRDA